MECEVIRRAVLGSIRYGKPLIVDLMDVPLLSDVEKAFDRVEMGLWSRLQSRELLQGRNFQTLIRESDGERYEIQKFSPFCYRTLCIYCDYKCGLCRRRQERLSCVSHAGVIVSSLLKWRTIRSARTNRFA
jgi:hypothetical protein